MKRNGNDIEERAPVSGEKPLQSWKEIAAYLERDERTAQRWEKQAGLPVRRHHDGPRSTVYSYPSELDKWRSIRKPKNGDSESGRTIGRRSVLTVLALLASLVIGWFVTFGPILNPPNPLVEAEGMTIRQVWAGPKADTYGAPSPDGRYLSFVDWETGDLAVRDLVTEENRRLTNKGTWSESSEQADESVISPDGKQVVYTWLNESGWDLRLVGVDGSSPRILYEHDTLSFVSPNDWSADGKYVLATFWRKDETKQIGLIAVSDGSVRILKEMDSTFPKKVSLSPNGRHVVYDFPPEKGHLKRDIYLLSTETKQENRLVEHLAHDSQATWTPDGKNVVFVSDRTGSSGLWIIRVVDGRAQGSPRLVKADIGRFWAMGFIQEGALYYGVSTGLFDVYLTRLNLKAGKILEEPKAVSQHMVGRNLMPDWSPDGKYLAFQSRRSQSHATRNVGARIVIREFATGEERELAPKLKSFILPSWSPDGRFFLALGRDMKGQYKVVKIDSESGDVEAIVERKPRTLERGLTWSRDGKAIFYRRSDFADDSFTLYCRDLETGHEQELLRLTEPESFNSAGLSWDGNHFAFLFENRKTGLQAIHVMPAKGGESRQLLKVQEPETLVRLRSLAWTPDDKEILFVKGSDGESAEPKLELMAVSIEGRVPRTLGPMKGPVHDLSLHPDGTLLAFTAGGRKVEVWVMEDFLPDSVGSN